jgi:putative ABC transport system substrate-binding protein
VGTPSSNHRGGDRRRPTIRSGSLNHVNGRTINPQRPVRGAAKDAAYIPPGSVNYQIREQIGDAARQYRVPTVADLDVFARAGALLSYGVDVSTVYVRAAEYIDKILRGAKPADLPVEQPTKFRLIINVKTANALGLYVPLHLQQLADELIE